MPTLTLTPKLQIHQPESPRPRESLLLKFFQWLRKKNLRTLYRVTCTVTIWLLIFAPHFLFLHLFQILRWHSYRIPIFCALLSVTLNVRALYRFALRIPKRRRSGNQHTFHGVPSPELASFLFDTGGFRYAEAMSKLGLSQGQYGKIAETLEKHHILERGENNARVLSTITREELVRQLRENFPLTFDDVRKIWVERDGAFARWTLDKEHAERRTLEKTMRAQRKLGRLQSDTATFAHVMALSAQSGQ